MKKILVVEDEDNSRRLIIDMLTLHGYSAISAADGKAGIKMALKDMPDMIICDIKMPRTDGYAVLKKIQNTRKTSSLPFIFLTGMADRKEIRKGMESGADDYITKPFTDDELIRAVRIQFKKAAEKYRVIHQHGKNENAGKKEYTRSGHIYVEVNRKPRILKLSSIKFISAMGDYSMICIDENNRVMVRRPMKQWENLLPEEQFIRIHRNTIINIGQIDKIEKWFNNSVNLYMKNHPEPLLISRRYFSRLKHTL
ncbi:MAG: LytR/AlgR family response regulator transcription factor [Bacteroidota bacterium]